MEKFKNKYRISSHRKPNWDYSADALYFLTIVTQNRECNLGKIIKSGGGSIEMELSDFGKIVEQEWYKSFEIRSELFLHDFILMPNHLHTVVEIYNENRVDITTTTESTTTEIFTTATVETHDVETHGRVSLQPWFPPIESNISSIKRNPPIRLPKSISSFIAGFKSAVNTKIDDYIDNQRLTIPKYNRNNHFFQPNYHDHIIRNNFEYQAISNYIANNPLNWSNDKFYT